MSGGSRLQQYWRRGQRGVLIATSVELPSRHSVNQVLYSSHLLFFSLSVNDVEWMAKIQLILKTTCDRNKPQEFICAPGFCLEVVAVASISLPHSLQPPRLLLGVFRGGGEAGEESVEASAREKRKERGVEQRVTVFQRSQRLRAGIEVKAALWQKSIRLKIKFATPCQLFFTFVYWPTLSTSSFSPRFSAISCCLGSCREQKFVPNRYHILPNLMVCAWNIEHCNKIVSKLINEQKLIRNLAALWKSSADPWVPPVAWRKAKTPQALWSEAEKLCELKLKPVSVIIEWSRPVTFHKHPQL